LIREARGTTKRMPAHVDSLPPTVIAAVAGQGFHPGPVERHPLEMSLHSAQEHHGDQEDYIQIQNPNSNTRAPKENPGLADSSPRSKRRRSH
jgi:hypothetical protein